MPVHSRSLNFTFPSSPTSAIFLKRSVCAPSFPAAAIEELDPATVPPRQSSITDVVIAFNCWVVSDDCAFAHAQCIAKTPKAVAATLVGRMCEDPGCFLDALDAAWCLTAASSTKTSGL